MHMYRRRRLYNSLQGKTSLQLNKPGGTTDPRDAKNPLAEAIHTKPKHQLGASRRHNTTLRQRSTLRIERRSLCMCLGKRKAGEDRRLNLGGNDCSPLSVRQSTLFFPASLCCIIS
ncbi:hypothetical protein NPIL_561131 [Nephila pilipes]|uniref:Uncharacterized protein n=1 Tax=Nephila pilipes TaxID=299642 RepID=A0A8X6QTU8_NEPPI|nr:hypothetical protein NPIL_561131 [Nephila pilipes]